jgi:hypothetical protein
VADTAIRVLGPRATVRAWETLTPMIGFLRTLVPVVHPWLFVAILTVLPSILIESLLVAHSRERRRRQLAKAAAPVRPAEPNPAGEPAWSDLFAADPRRFVAPEASFAMVIASWDMSEPRPAERAIIPELMLRHLGEILTSVVALAGLGLILAGVFA